MALAFEVHSVVLYLLNGFVNVIYLLIVGFFNLIHIFGVVSIFQRGTESPNVVYSVLAIMGGVIF